MAVQDLAKIIKFSLSDEAQEIYEKEGKEGLEKVLRRMEGTSKKKTGGTVRAMSLGGRAAIKGTEFKGTF